MPHRQEEAMIGPGGKIRVPRSESAVISGVITLIANGEYREAISLLKRLRSQVREGYHKNPYTPFRVIGPIAEDVYDIRYRHSKNGKDYEHEFNGAVNILAIERHGKKDMIITSTRGLPLWDEFPDER